MRQAHGSPASTCSEADWLADQLGMSRERFQAARERLQFKRLADYADQLHGAFYTMKHDWKGGDFELPRYAEIHMEAMEQKALQLGKLLYAIQNSQADQP